MLWLKQSALDKAIEALIECSEELRTVRGFKVKYSLGPKKAEILVLSALSTIGTSPTSIMPEGTCFVTMFSDEMTDSYPSDGGKAYREKVRSE